jgi:hypothetical protein
VQVRVLFPVLLTLRKIMNELKEKLMGLGLSAEQVDSALHAVAEFAKSKVPAEYQGIVDSLLAGQTPDLAALGGGMLDKVKGMFS